MTKLLGKLEGLLLLVIGSSSAWFALYGDYWLLMNPKFMWLTAIGGFMLLAIGLVLLFSSPRRADFSALAVFMILLLLVLIVRPYSRESGASAIPMQASIRETAPIVHSPDFTEINLGRLYVPSGNRDDDDPTSLRFVAKGLVVRSPELAQDGHVAFVEPLISCCLADAVAVGFRVPQEKLEGIDNMAWGYVYGRLRKFDTPISQPNFRVGAVLMTMVSEDYTIEVEKVLPLEEEIILLTDKLSSERYATFVQLLKAAGLWEQLNDEGEAFTVFAPIEEAFETLPDGTLEALLKRKNRKRLRAWLSYHIIPGTFMKRDFASVDSLRLDGRSITVRMEGSTLFLEKARVLFADTVADNGVLHAVYPAVLPLDSGTVVQN